VTVESEIPLGSVREEGQPMPERGKRIVRAGRLSRRVQKRVQRRGRGGRHGVVALVDHRLPT
jgi:hypothetical protein